MSKRVSQLSAASTLTGAELVGVSQLSAAVTITGTTISAQASDNSYNDSANGFITAGFAVGKAVKVDGFTGSGTNNITSGVVTAVTAGKLTIGGADGDVIVDDAAGEPVTIIQWESVRAAVQDVADLAGGGGGGGTSLGGLPGGRLTLTSDTSVTTSDVSAATTVYYTPHLHDLCPLWDGSAWLATAFAETALALGAVTSGANYDVFAYLSAGSLALEKLAWTNDTNRATALQRYDGRWCKAGDKTRLYLGTIRTTSTTQTEDSVAKRFVWNAYNQVRRRMLRLESTTSWEYSTETWRQANGAAANKLEFVIGLPGDSVRAVVNGSAHSNLRAFSVGIGYDSTTAPTGVYQLSSSIPTDYTTSVTVEAQVSPTEGYHYLAWLERAQNGDVTWNGLITTSAFVNQAGITGDMYA